MGTSDGAAPFGRDEQGQRAAEKVPVAPIVVIAQPKRRRFISSAFLDRLVVTVRQPLDPRGDR